MSRGTSFLISAVLVFLISASPIMCLPGMTTPLVYMAPTENQNGSFQGELPIKRIGSLQLPKAVVQFAGEQVNVLAVPDWLFDRSLVLSGPLVKAQVDMQGQSSNVHGLVYFLEGLWLTNLGSATAIDVIDTVSGEQLRGRIRSVLDNAFAFKPDNGPMRRLPFADIKNIRSPRAYVFSIPADMGKLAPAGNAVQFDSNSISFAPTFGSAALIHNARVPKSTLSGTEPGISTAEIGTFIGLNVANEIAPAIAIPLVLNKHNLQGGLNEIQRYNNAHGGTGQFSGQP